MTDRNSVDARHDPQSFPKSIAWAGGASVARQCLRFAGTLALARLLTPGDYGLAAIVLSINGFVTIFTDLGLKPALIHARELTAPTLATAIWMNFISGAILTAAFWLLAVPIATLFDQRELIVLVRLASLQFVCALQVVPLALVERRSDFRTVGLIETATTLGGLCVSIGAAVAGFGAASLVLGPIAASILLSVGAWCAVGRLPIVAATMADARTLWEYSWGVVGFSGLNYWSRNIDNLTLGKLSTPASLGLYSRAYTLMLLPVTQMATVLSRVLLPKLSRLNHDRRELGSTWLSSVWLSWLVGLPVALGTAVAAPAITETLFGGKWLGMVPILQVLALSVPPQLIGRTQGAVFQALGQTALQFKIGLMTNAVTVVAVLIGARWGATGVASAVCLSMYCSILVPARTVLRLLEIRVGVVVGMLLPSTIAALLMAAFAAIPRLTSITDSSLLMLTIQVSTGILMYLGIVLWSDRVAIASILHPRRRRPVEEVVR